MGWIDKLLLKVSRNTVFARMLNGYTPIFSQFGDDIYASDVVQQAMFCIVSEMKKLRPVHEREAGEDYEPVNSSVNRMLNHPNRFMTKSDFIEKMIWPLLWNYNSFAIPVYEVWYDKNGTEQRNYKEIYPVQPAFVQFEEDSAGTMYIRMRFANNYETVLPYSDVIHLKYHFSKNDFMGGDETGQPNNKALLKVLQINENMMRGVDAAMRSSFAINGVVKVNTMLDGGKTEAALKELEQKLASSESGFLPLDMKTEFIPIKKEIKLVDADTLKFLDEKILRHWGVSIPILTGKYNPEEYASFYQKALEPIIISMSDEFSRVLFTDRQKSFGNHIKFYPKDLVFMTMTQVLEMVRLLGDSGSLFENEKRRAFGLPPCTELVGLRMQSLNYVNADIADTYQVGRQNSGGGENGSSNSNGNGAGKGSSTGTDNSTGEGTGTQEL